MIMIKKLKRELKLWSSQRLKELSGLFKTLGKMNMSIILSQSYYIQTINRY